MDNPVTSAEQLLVGMLMLGRHTPPDDFTPAAFYSPICREVAAAIHGLMMAGSAHGLEQVVAWLLRTKKLDIVGGRPALTELYIDAREVTWATPAKVWAQVFDAHQTRQVCLAVSGALERASQLDAEALIALVYEQLGKIRLARPEATLPIADVVREAVREMAKRSESGGLAGVPTGMPDLDLILGGLAEGSVTILAGRPSHGKSALARTIADNANAAGCGVHVFSIEDTSSTYGMRVLADHARVDLGELRVIGPKTPRLVLDATMAAGSRLYERRGWLVDDTAGLSSTQIAMRVRKHKSANDTRLVVVDYVQLMREKGARDKGEEVARAAEALVQLARDEGVAVLLLSQLSREVEKRPDKRPMLSDLRETGVLEQVAYAVLMAYRPEVYMAEDEADPKNLRGKGCVVVAKNKNGRTGEAWLKWDAPTATYRGLSLRAA